MHEYRNIYQCLGKLKITPKFSFNPFPTPFFVLKHIQKQVYVHAHGRHTHTHTFHLSCGAGTALSQTPLCSKRYLNYCQRKHVQKSYGRSYNYSHYFSLTRVKSLFGGHNRGNKT